MISRKWHIILMPLFKLWAILVISVIWNNSYSQSYHFKNYSVEDGLPFISVSTIFQDSKGNLWSGGYGGLSKFDGLSFTNYSPKDGLINHYVQAIKEDKEGNLWIGTIEGASRFDGTTFVNFTTEDGMVGNSIKSIVIGRNGNIYFGTSKGLSIYDGRQFKNFTTADGLISNNILVMEQDEEDNLWIGTSKGLSKYNGEKFENFIESAELSGASITDIEQDDAGNIWLVVSEGIYIIVENENENENENESENESENGKGFEVLQNFEAGKGIAEGTVNALINSAEGTMWIGTSNGLFSFQHSHDIVKNIDRFTHYPVADNYNSNWIACLFEDYEENMWLGTYAGLFKFRGSSFTGYNIEEGLENNFIYQVFRDSRNNLWVGTAGGGIHVMVGERFRPYTTSDGLAGNTVWAGLEDTDGNIWFGTNGGVSKYDPKMSSLSNPQFQNFSTADGLISDTIIAMHQDRRGIIWMGGAGGVSAYANGRFTNYDLNPNSATYQVWSIMEDRNGRVWFCNYEGGLYYYDGQKVVDAGKEIGISSNAFLSIIEDKSGSIWFATFEGVIRFDPTAKKDDAITTFTVEDGLSSDLVYILILDANEKYLWIGTNQGLNKLKLYEFRKSGKKLIEHYGKEEGFTGVECNSNGAFREQDGTIWFGTVDGLIKYDPRHYYDNRQESKTSITGFQIFYKDTVLKQNTVLNYDQNHIIFNFNGICFTNPDKVAYHYKLEGYDEEWSPMVTERLAKYTGLPPGDYTFKVVSCNNEMIWNKDPVEFSFVIASPFWQKWWFRTTVIGLFAFIIWYFIYFRIRSIKKKNSLNSKMEQLKLEALRSQMNPHFIFNCMNTIQHYINSNEKKEANMFLSKFAELMRMILDNSQKSLVRLSDDLKALRLYLDLERLRFDNRFKYEINIGDGIDADSQLIPPMIIHPYVENAIIHGLLNKEAEGKVTVNLGLRDNFLICEVEDDGVGRARAEELKKDKHGHKPAGIKLTNERIETLNLLNQSQMHININDLYDENGKGNGTRVEIAIEANLD